MVDYEYTPIEDKVIRILTLLPGRSDHVLRIKLRTIELSAPVPSYEALSYVWGSSAKPEKVVVVAPSVSIDLSETFNLLKTFRSLSKIMNTTLGVLAVTENLATALRHLRREDESRDLWIDAICINQQDLIERGTQVAIMGDIYAQAQQVLVWLVTEGGDSTLAVETLAFIGSLIEADWRQIPVEMKPSLVSDPNWAWDHLVIPRLADKTWRALEALFDRPWFARLWIWQEVRMAQTAIVICGTATVPWSILGNAVLFLSCRPKPFGAAALAYRINATYNIFRSTLLWLPNMLERTNSATCTDPRDRIYSLMNLVDEADCIVGLKPDYSAEPHKVFQEVVLRHQTRNGNLKMLSCCEMYGTDVKKPTWVPDWSKRRMCQPLYFPRSCWMSKMECSLREKPKEDDTKERTSPDSNVLRVTGMHVTTVKTAKKLWSRPESDQDIITSAYMLRDLMVSLGLHQTYIAGGNMIEAFCRTIRTGIFADFHIPPLPMAPPAFSTLKDSFVKFIYEHTDPVEPRFAKNIVTKVLDNRAFLTTREGYIGLAPEAARPGDEVWIVLGCQSPLLLRATREGEYEVVGECYLQGIMFGEALLGPLPESWMPASVKFDPAHAYVCGFVNGETGKTRIEDPRLGPLPPGWRILDHADTVSRHRYVNDETGEGFGTKEHYHLNEFSDPRMTAQALAERGVTLRTIELV
ncbi:MAG: hypothetical protein LQ352_001788 [Teloschistes flavicans]|nr:MAG: hypothetical protein LQ352_001788 [Teloschistes flavicans]